MTVERRFEAGYREAETDEPGLALEDDGTVTLIAPGGTRGTLTANGGSQPQVRNIPISAAEILALGDSPVELIPAPGEGKILALLSCQSAVDGTTPYVFEQDVTLELKVGNLRLAYLTSLQERLASQTSPYVQQDAPIANWGTSNLDNVNAPALLRTTNDSNPTGGDLVASVTVCYVVVDLAS